MKVNLEIDLYKRSQIDLKQPSISLITRLAWSSRRFLEPHWREAHLSWGAEIPIPPSQSMCRYSSIFLAEVFQMQLGCGWMSVGGRPERHFNATPKGTVGILSPHGIWNDHCWLLGHGLIVDITADQFGYPPVIVTTAFDIRYRANLSFQDLEADLLKLRHRPMVWLAAWRNRQLK